MFYVYASERVGGLSDTVEQDDRRRLVYCYFDKWKIKKGISLLHRSTEENESMVVKRQQSIMGTASVGEAEIWVQIFWVL